MAKLVTGFFLARTALYCIPIILLASAASAQTSSIGARGRAKNIEAPPTKPSRETPKPQINPVYRRVSWITLAPRKPKSYRVGDLLTIIVRQRRAFESDADLKTRKQVDISSELDAFAKLTQGGVGATAFRRGKPNIDYKFQNQIRSRADTSREDNLTLRITGKLIDVKPNGLLVFEGRTDIAHDDEVSAITITGMCRKEDVTADNTILSSQVADLVVRVNNRGAMRAAAGRGWLSKLVDWLGPF